MKSSPSFFLQPFAALLSALALCTSTTHTQAQTLPDKPVVKGTFLGDGKDGKIQYLVVQTREPFSDKAAIRLIFTEKDPSKSKKPDFDAGFKKLGSALILSVFKDGGVFGCEVAHTAHPKSPFSALGKIKIKDFKVTDTHVSGVVITPGELDSFDQKWQVELTFSTPLPKGAFAATAEQSASSSSSSSITKKGEDQPEEAPVATGPKMPIEKLPLPATAVDVEYKKVVEHIAFRSDASVNTVAKDFSAKLKEQGWQEGPGNLMAKTNAILKRKLNGAELTIMVKSAASGSTITVFTEGLDWSNPPASAAAADTTPSKPVNTKTPDAKDIEAEANRLINEAMKQLPKF